MDSRKSDKKRLAQTAHAAALRANLRRRKQAEHTAAAVPPAGEENPTSPVPSPVRPSRS